MSRIYGKVGKALPSYLRSASQMRTPVSSIIKTTNCHQDVQPCHHPCQPEEMSYFAKAPWCSIHSVAATKPEPIDIQASGAQSPSPKVNPPSDEKPSFDKLQEVEKILIDSLTNIFLRPMNYKIYRDDVLFIDNIRGKRTTNLFQYIQQAALLRAAGHVKFAFVKFIILNTDISKEEGRITVRWKIVGIGALQVMLQFWKFKLWDWKGIMERQGTWYDGVSYFDIDSNGLIYQHIADKMMIDKDKDVLVKTPKTVLAAGLLAALLFPESSLHCSSSKYSSKSITLPM